MPAAQPLGHFSVMEFRRCTFGLSLWFHPTLFWFKETHKSVTVVDCIQGLPFIQWKAMCLIMFQVLYWCKFNPDDCLRKLFPFYRWKMEGYRPCPMSQMKRTLELRLESILCLIICVLLMHSQALSCSFINLFTSILSSTLKISPSQLSFPLFLLCFVFVILFPLFIFFLLSPFFPTLPSFSSLRQETKPTRGLSMLNFKKQWHLQELLGNEGLDSEVRIKCYVEFDDMEKSLQIKTEGINN